MQELCFRLIPKNCFNAGNVNVYGGLNILPQLIDIFMTNDNEKSIQLALDCIIMIAKDVNVAKFTLIQEAKRSKPFYQTVLQIPQLAPYFECSAMHYA